ncbi:hypothetical protein QYS47_28175 [Marivirga arenosa]|uniref:Uncharacterized protein n=1 Tax=Marivirga arenosa TaxID=3059076 RepID=A0AA51ZW01_9BACT|nr:hypothetical protein QYS47_28175 [Marivirga sp. BKB1-2]
MFNRNRFAIVITIGSAILLIVNLYSLDYDHLSFSEIAGPLSNIFLILAMFTVLLPKKND